MEILVKIDQAASLARGFDAPTSTVRVEVDPTELTQEERDVLAAVLRDGHDATQRGLARAGDGISGYSGYSTTASLQPLLLSQPGLTGLREAIAEHLAELRTYRTERDEKAAAAREQMAAREREALADTSWGVETLDVYMRRDGSVPPAAHGRERGVVWTSVKVDLPVCMPDIHSISVGGGERVYPSDEFLDAQEARIAEREALRNAACEAALPELRAKLAALVEAEAAEKAEYDALYARLPEGLRERDVAGYAANEEVPNAIRDLIRQDAGYTKPVPRKDSKALEELSDGEYATLLRVRESAPEDAEVTPMVVWDAGGEYRCATDYDDPDDIDSDDEVWVQRSGERRIIEISWSRGGVIATAELPLE